MDEIRQKFLRDRVLTASPAQRVVMLYDRLALDLIRARTTPDAAGPHLAHANQIVAELLGSLDASAGGPAENLSVLYGYLLREILQAQLSENRDVLPRLESMVATLRAGWAVVADGGSVTDATDGGNRSPALAGMSWSA